MVFWGITSLDTVWIRKMCRELSISSGLPNHIQWWDSMLWGQKAVNPRIRESINGRLRDWLTKSRAPGSTWFCGTWDQHCKTWVLLYVVWLQGLNRMYLVFEFGMEFKGLSHIWGTPNHTWFTFHCSLLTQSFKAFLLGLGGRCCFTGGPTAQSDVHLRPCLAPPLL